MWNNQPKPFIWTATADVILDKVRRCKELSVTLELTQLAGRIEGEQAQKAWSLRSRIC